MATTFKFPLDIPKTYYLAVGQVVARMALVEFQIMTVIGHLLKLKNPKQVRISFMGMTMKARLGTLKALSDKWSPSEKLKQDIAGIIRDARKLSNVRNSFAHGQWGQKINRKRLHVIFTETSKDFYIPQAKAYSSKEITNKAAEVRALSKRIMRVIEEL